MGRRATLAMKADAKQPDASKAMPGASFSRYKRRHFIDHQQAIFNAISIIEQALVTMAADFISAGRMKCRQVPLFYHDMKREN